MTLFTTDAIPESALFNLPIANSPTRREVVFIESNVTDLQTLLQGLAGSEVHILDAGQDGLHQMAEILAGRDGIDAVHVISHGDSGAINLGTLTLDNNNLAAHQADLQAIGASLTADGDITLYGCNVGAGDAGATLVTSLATLTGADIAASSNLTGASSRGGDWTLEVHSGQIETVVPLSTLAMLDYQGTLATGTALEPSVTGNYDSNVGIALLSNGGHADVYLHQVGGDNSYVDYASVPEYIVKVVVANGANQIVQTLAVAGSDYVLNASVAKLLNGGFVVAWSADTSPDHDFSSLGSFYQIYDNAGVAQGSVQAIGGVGVNGVSLTALADGGFAAAYADADSADTLAVYGYSNGSYSLTRETSVGGHNGALLTNGVDSGVSVWSESSSSGGTPNVVQLSDGSIVITDATYVYHDSNYTPMGEYAFKFTSTGEVANFASGYSSQRLNWSFDLISNSGQHAIALSGGGFAVASLVYNSVGGTSSYELILLNNDGTPVTPANTVTHNISDPGPATSSSPKTYFAQSVAADTADTNVPNGNARFTLTESSDGNILIALPNSAHNGLDVYTYTSAGVAVGSPVDSGITVAPGASIERPVLAPAANGGFAISYDETHYDIVHPTPPDGSDYHLYTATPYSYGVPYSAIPNITPSFVGATTTADAAQNGVAIDLASLLHVSDADSGQTLTWSLSGAPAHGSLTISGVTAGSGSADITPGGAITYTPTAGFAGTDTLTVQVSDGTASATRTISINVAPVTPGTPQLAAGSDSGANHADQLTNSATLSFSGTGGAGDSLSTVQVFIDKNGNGSYDAGTDISGTATLSGGAWTVSGLSTSTLADGTYHVYAVTTAAGSLSSALSSALAVTIDKTAPALTFSGLALSADSGAAGDFLTNTAAQTVTATLSAAVTVGDIVEGSIDGGATWLDISNMVSGTSLSWTGVTLAASGALQLRVTDPAGNSSTSASQAYTVDNSPPAAPSTPVLDGASDSGPLNSDRITNVSSPTFTGTGEDGATVTLYDSDGHTVIGTALVAGGMWSISGALTEASHDLTVKQTDPAGNVSAASSALTVVIDTTAPTAIALSASAATEAGATAGAAVATLSASDTQAVSYGLVAGSGGNDAANALFSIVGNTLQPIGNLPVGTYHLYVSATDAAGNHSEQALTFVVANGPSVTAIERAASAPSTVAGAATEVVYTVTFSQAVTGVDVNDFVLTSSGTATGAVASVSGAGTTWAVTVNNLGGDGALRLDLNSSGTGIIDGAANAITSGYTAGQSYTLDHSTPAAPAAPAMTTGSDTGVSHSDAITSNATPTFTGTVEANASVTLYDSDGTTVLGTTSANGSGLWSITSTSALSAGAHSVSVKQTDQAGNVSPAGGTLSVFIDNTAPAGVALNTAVVVLANATNGATVATLQASDASAVSYALATGSAGNDADNGKFSITGSGLVANQNLPAGTYHVYVQATDAAGNATAQALSFDVVDAPGVSAIVRAASASATVPGVAAAVSYTVTFDQAVTGVDAADFTLHTTGNASGSIGSVTGNGTTWTVTVTGLAGDGALRLDLNSSGTGIQNSSAIGIASGYTAGETYALDHTAPSAASAPVMTTATDTGISHTDAITNNATPTFTGSGEAYATVKLYDTNGTTLLGSATADENGHWEITSSTLAAGNHTLTVKQTDAAGNVSPASGGLAVVIDTSAAAPAAPLLAAGSDSGVVGDHLTNARAPTITGTAEAYATVTLYDTDGSTVLGTASANGAGAWSIVSSTLSEAVHTLTVKQTDQAGNTSVASAALTLTIDATAPAAPEAPLLASASDSGTVGDGVTNVSTPVLTGSAEAGATVRLYDSNGTTVLGSAVADNSGAWSITSSALALGAHTLTVQQTDAAGNVSAAGAALALTIEAPPTPPATTIDGVQVVQQPVTLPGGGSGTQTTIPIVTNDRAESSGSSGVADIPLATSNNSNLLLAQVAAGFGLSASGGASQPAGNSLETLIAAILAATPDHPASDQSHLTGNGVTFLNQLAASVPLLVETITPVSGATAPSGSLTLTGTSTDSQHTALVIDVTGLAGGSTLVLNSVDFAAIVGSANVVGNTAGQILTGDAANQQFTVAAGSESSVFAGGGSDTLVFGSAAGPSGGARAQSAPGIADTVILHGGLGDDSVTFSGAAADYTVENHDGYLLVTAKAQPTQHALVINAETLKFSDTTVAVVNDASLNAIAGLYHDVLGRQADYLGISYWSGAAQNGVSLGDVALTIISSAESQSRHAMVFNGDSAHDVELLYQGIFGRASDAGGLAFWVEQMNNGVTLSQVASSFMTSEEITAHKIGVQDWDFQVG